MYELMILSLLARRVAHGYLIAKILNDTIGPYTRISNGRLYPLLAKMEETGLIEIIEENDQKQHGERILRSYQITERGLQRLHTLMLDTTSNQGEYQRIFMQKVAVLNILKPQERLYLINHYINYCQAHVLHLTAEIEDLETHENEYHWDNAIRLAPTLNVMKHMAEQWRHELAWAFCLRQQEVAYQEEHQHDVESHL